MISVRTRAWVAVAGAALCALYLYRPWEPLPFPLIDFSDNLWLLRPPSLLGKWEAFSRFYAAQGRWTPLPFARWIAEWSLFGAHFVAWQLTAFVLMCLVVAGSFCLFRRLIGNSVGAAAGAALYLVAAPALAGWTSLMSPEPLALLFVLGAGLMATRFRTAVRWQIVGFLIAALIALALLSKETSVAALPFIALLACCFEDGRLRAPRLDRRAIFALVLGVGVTVATFAPEVLVALHAPRGAYVGGYGRGGLGARRALSEFAAMMVPLPPHSVFEPSLAFVPDALYVAIFVFAVLTTVRHARWQLDRLAPDLAMVGLGLSLPICGTLAYLPLAYWGNYYALPFFAGSALLLAWAVAALVRLAPRSLLPVVGGSYAIIFLCVAGSARLAAQQEAARRQVFGELAEYLGQHASGRVVVETEPADVLAGEGPIQRRSLGRYTTVLYPEVKPLGFQHGGCVDALSPPAEPTSPAIFVSYATLCGGFSHPTDIFRRAFRYFDWPVLAIGQDSTRDEVWARP